MQTKFCPNPAPHKRFIKPPLAVHFSYPRQNYGRRKLVMIAERGKPTYSKNNLILYHRFQHKSRTDCPGIESRPPRLLLMAWSIVRLYCCYF